MLTGALLPLRFDQSALKADLARVGPEDWARHYNERDYGGNWRGAALRSASGSTGDLIAGRAGGVVTADTPLLGRCPYFRQVIRTFECPLKAVRLLSLAPGSFIREHSDDALDYEDGEVRIHVPIQTNPAVEFYICGERLVLEEGNAYYVNVNLPHRVNNGGEAERIHLVIDAKVNDWVRGLFARSTGIARTAPPSMGSRLSASWRCRTTYSAGCCATSTTGTSSPQRQCGSVARRASIFTRAPSMRCSGAARGRVVPPVCRMRFRCGTGERIWSGWTPAIGSRASRFSTTRYARVYEIHIRVSAGGPRQWSRERLGARLRRGLSSTCRAAGRRWSGGCCGRRGIA